MEWNNLCHHQYKTFGSASYVLCEARIIESVISNRIIENGNPVTTDAVCKLVKPPAIVIATEMAPIAIPKSLYVSPLDSRYLLLPCRTICVVESALVTMSKNIKTTANMLVISANGNFDSNSNKATV